MSEVTAKELRKLINKYSCVCHNRDDCSFSKEHLAAFDAMAEKAALWDKLERLWMQKSEPECLWNPGTSEYYIQLNDYPSRYFGKTPAEALKAVPE